MESDFKKATIALRNEIAFLQKKNLMLQNRDNQYKVGVLMMFRSCWPNPDKGMNFFIIRAASMSYVSARRSIMLCKRSCSGCWATRVEKAKARTPVWR